MTLNAIIANFQTFKIVDLLDIIIIAFLIYQLLGIIRTASSTHPIDMAYAHTRSSILTALALTILAAILAAWLLARRQLRPIQQMTADALRISHGELSHRLACKINGIQFLLNATKGVG